jgi:hypothetical protein
VDPEQAGVHEKEKNEWSLIDLRLIPEKHRRSAFRLNALGSNFYFGRGVLGYKDFTPNLHYKMCRSVEQDILKAIKEYPRGCFKTSVFSITTPMWWALPFTESDEKMMRTLGYGDEWIRWMKRAHDQNTSTLILSEVDENAQKMGREITTHYRENVVFQQTFPEIQPPWNRSTIWNMSSMTHKRSGNGTREGTYEVSGVGGALQSRHYPRVIEDDLFGEKALYSPTEAEYIIEFHRKLPGLYRADPARPDHIGDNLVIGNRWAVHDLNGWIRANQPSYDIETHAIDGGCCPDHPKGVMIFPELFGPEKIRLLREQLGPTAFAAQYLNNPLDESTTVFRPEWIQHYSTQNVPHPFGARDADGQMRLLTAFQHDTFDGKVMKDVYLSELQRFVILDPAHTEDEKRGRARHAIQTIGYLPGKKPRFYLLNSWAKHCTYSEMVDVALARAKAWKVDRLWCEVLAGQDGWMYYLREKNRDVNIRVEGLKKDRSPGAKDRRIMSLEPLFANHQIWASRADAGYTDFRFEYDAYKSNQTVDLLDTLGYATQCVNLGAGTREETADWMRRRENWISNQTGIGYSS